MSITNTIVLLLQPHLKDTTGVDNIAELLMKGGIIMIPIILLSIFSIYLFIERFIYIRRSSVIDETMVNNVITGLRNKTELMKLFCMQGTATPRSEEFWRAGSTIPGNHQRMRRAIWSRQQILKSQ